MCIRDRDVHEYFPYGETDKKFGYRENNDEEVGVNTNVNICLLYTSDAADERSSVDLGGRRIIKKKKIKNNAATAVI